MYLITLLGYTKDRLIIGDNKIFFLKLKVFVKLFWLTVVILALSVTLGLSLLFYLELDVRFSVPFLKNYLSKSIQEKISDHSVAISSVKLATGQGLSKLQIEIHGLDITSINDESSLYVNKTSIEFDFFDLIAKGNIDYSIRLSDIPIELERTLENNFIIKLDRFKLFDTKVSQKLFKTNFKNIKFFQIQNPNLTIIDRSSKTYIKPEMSNLDFNFSDGDAILELSAVIPQGSSKDATVWFMAKHSFQLQSTKVSARVTNLLPSLFYKIDSPRYDFLKKINIPISSDIDFYLNKRGEVTAYTGNIYAKNNVIRQLPILTNDLKLNEVSLNFVSSIDISKVELQNIRIDSNLLISKGTGEINFKDIFNIKLSFPKFNIIGINNSTEDILLSTTDFEIDIDPIANTIFLHRAEIDHGNTKLIAEGKLSIGSIWHLDDYLNVNVFDIDIDHLQLFNLTKIKNLDLDILSFDSIDDLSLSLGWRIDNSLQPTYTAHASFNKVVLSILGLNSKVFHVLGGDISIDSKSLIVNAEEIIPYGRNTFDLELSDTQLSLEYNLKNPQLILESNFTSDLTKINNQHVKLFSKKIGLKFDSKMVFDEYVTAGLVQGRFKGKFTDLDLAKLTATSISVFIDLEDCFLNLKPMSKPLKIERINIRASQQETVLEFEGLFNQKPVLGNFTKVFIKDVASVLTILWEPNLVDLKAFLDTEFIYFGAGNLVVQTDLTFPPNQTAIYRFKVDITDLALTVPSLGFIKKVEDPGIIEFGWTESKATNFKFLSEGYELAGLAYFDLKQQIEKVEFHKVKLSDYFLGSALFSIGDLENTLKINGQSYDYVKSPNNPLARPKKNLKVTLNVESLKVRQDLELNEFYGLFNLAKDFQGSGVGQLNGGPEIQIKVKTNDDQKSYWAYSRSAGDVLLKSNIYSSGYGGEINFELHKQEGKDTVGSLHIRDMRVIGAPFLAKLISLSSIEGLLELLGSNGMVLNNIKAEYSLNNDFLYIKNGVATNQSFGITLAGSREMGNKIINYTGVLSPMFSLNGIVKKLPLIGNLLGGNEGEGIFGINYFATGTLPDPRVTVNPLSIITPGKFRELLN